MAASASVSESMTSVLKDFPGGDGKEEYSITHLAEGSGTQYANIPTSQIYKETTLCGVNFLKNYKIMTVEETFSLENKQYDMYLLTRDDIRKHMEKYDFLHIGLVQVYVRRVNWIISDARMLVGLRDAKYPNLKDSVLAAFEMSWYSGTTKFNWFPNFSSSLSDLAYSNGLVMTMEPFAEGRENSTMFSVTYRMHYKLMKGSLQPRSRLKIPGLEVNTEYTRVLVPKPAGGN